MDELPSHAKSKKLVRKDVILHVSIYMKCPERAKFESQKADEGRDRRKKRRQSSTRGLWGGVIEMFSKWILEMTVQLYTFTKNHCIMHLKLVTVTVCKLYPKSCENSIWRIHSSYLRNS